MTDLDKLFNDPPRSFSPVPIWWWSGEKLGAQRLRWQLERFAEGGVYNLLVMNLAPSGPLYGSDPDDPPYFSEEWWTLFRGVCEDARALGTHLWFYDQFGFSGANMQARLVMQHPAFAGQSLECITCNVEGTGMLECPEAGTPIAASVIPIDGQGLRLVGKMHWYKVEPGVLDRACRDFDVLDDASIQRGEVRDGRLHIGEECYRAIVLPGCSILEDDTAAFVSRSIRPRLSRAGAKRGRPTTARWG